MGDIMKLLGGNRVSKPEKSEKKPIAPTVTSLLAQWRTIGTHLIKNVPSSYDLIRPLGPNVKVAAFDLDNTMIETKSGGTFARGADDWQWRCSSKTPDNLAKYKQLFEQGYLLVIFTNQGGVVANKTSKSYTNFTSKLSQIVKQLKQVSDKPCDILVFAAARKPRGKSTKPSDSSEELHNACRKPQIGMWQELVTFLKHGDLNVDIESSFYIGDAAGRKGDFLDSDKGFAHNVGLKFYTPEEFFEGDLTKDKKIEEEKEDKIEEKTKEKTKETQEKKQEEEQKEENK